MCRGSAAPIRPRASRRKRRRRAPGDRHQAFRRDRDSERSDLRFLRNHQNYPPTQQIPDEWAPRLRDVGRAARAVAATSGKMNHGETAAAVQRRRDTGVRFVLERLWFLLYIASSIPLYTRKLRSV